MSIPQNSAIPKLLTLNEVNNENTTAIINIGINTNIAFIILLFIIVLGVSSFILYFFNLFYFLFIYYIENNSINANPAILPAVIVILAYLMANKYNAVNPTNNTLANIALSLYLITK